MTLSLVTPEGANAKLCEEDTMRERRRRAVPVLAAIILTLGCLGGGPPAAAQPSDCAGGIVHDDGSWENAYGTGSFLFAHYVMRIDPPFSPAALEDVCICWTRTSPDSSISLDVNVWDSDGPGGAPGTLLGTATGFSSTMVPQTLDQVVVISRFYRYDLSGVGISTSRPVYVGPVWDAGTDAEFFLCADQNGPATQPAYLDIGLLAGMRPPQTPLGTAGNFPSYRNLGIRAVPALGDTISLAQAAGLIVPGYEVDVDDPEGTTTLFAVRNTSDDPVDVEVDYHLFQVAETPLRADAFRLEGQETLTWSIRNDLSGLIPTNGIASGLALIREVGEPSAPNLEGDYLQVDFSNDFAGGDRLVRPAEFCTVQEIRFVDFGSSTTFRVLVDEPQGGGDPSFDFTAYDETGEMVTEGTHFTADHLNVFDLAFLGITESFGTLVFDFTDSGGGWVSGRYSAFGRFSVDLESACRDQ